jgi:hypothetical protein
MALGFKHQPQLVFVDANNQEAAPGHGTDEC